MSYVYRCFDTQDMTASRTTASTTTASIATHDHEESSNTSISVGLAVTLGLLVTIFLILIIVIFVLWVSKLYFKNIIIYFITIKVVLSVAWSYTKTLHWFLARSGILVLAMEGLTTLVAVQL